MGKWKKWVGRILLLGLAGCLVYFMGWLYPAYPAFEKTFYLEDRLQWFLRDEEGLMYPDLEFLDLEHMRYNAVLHGRTLTSRPTGEYHIKGTTDGDHPVEYSCTEIKGEPPEREADLAYRGVEIWTGQTRSEVAYRVWAEFFLEDRFYTVGGSILKVKILPQDAADFCRDMQENALTVCREMIDRALEDGADAP